MKTKLLISLAVLLALMLPLVGQELQPAAATPHWTVLAWNDLGIHCMDKDYSVFGILPPFNNLHVQLIDNTGKLVRSSTGLTITYQGMKDATGSFTITSAPHTNFWQYVLPLFGGSPPPDMGLAGQAMPGAKNTPQALAAFDPTYFYFSATGIPMVPIDNCGQDQYLSDDEDHRQELDRDIGQHRDRPAGILRDDLHRVPCFGLAGGRHAADRVG